MLSPRRRILCADDNDDTCFMLSALLTQSNYETKSASTVAETLRLAQSEGFDLYMLDNIFPDGTGIELCRKLRAFDPSTPILFYSGAAFESDKQQAIAAGAQAYLTKPSIDGLVETITNLLNNGDT